MNFEDEHCVPCRSGSASLSVRERNRFLKSVPEWHISDQTPLRLMRIFRFASYAQAVHFTNQLTMIAENEDHHPKIILEWKSVQVEWWTHAVSGLHRNDFVMAAQSDALYQVEL